MLRGFRHAFAVVVLVVALMSGIQSLVREYLLFQYPNRFQEAPLFWACLRIACVVSFAFLWYEERHKMILLEKSLTPPPSLKRQLIQLSQSILDFVFERSKGVPPFPPSTLPQLGGDFNVVWAELEKTQNQVELVRIYEQETSEIYEYKYQRAVTGAIVSLKSLGLDTSCLDETVRDLRGEHDPEHLRVVVPASGSIKQIGQQLGTIADQIKEP